MYSSLTKFENFERKTRDSESNSVLLLRSITITSTPMVTGGLGRGASVAP